MSPTRLGGRTRRLSMTILTVRRRLRKLRWPGMLYPCSQATSSSSQTRKKVRVKEKLLRGVQLPLKIPRTLGRIAPHLTSARCACCRRQYGGARSARYRSASLVWNTAITACASKAKQMRARLPVGRKPRMAPVRRNPWLDPITQVQRQRQWRRCT